MSLNITEFAGLGASDVGNTPFPALPSLAVQNLAVGVASVPSAAFSANTTVIRVHAEEICYVALQGGTNPVASASSTRFGLGQTEYFRVTPGQQIAVIQAA